MKFESTPEHVGSGKPLETATEAIKRLSAVINEKEAQAEQARRANNPATAAALENERSRLRKERDDVLRKIAENKKYKLAG